MLHINQVNISQSRLLPGIEHILSDASITCGCFFKPQSAILPPQLVKSPHRDPQWRVVSQEAFVDDAIRLRLKVVSFSHPLAWETSLVMPLSSHILRYWVKGKTRITHCAGIQPYTR